MGLEYIYEGNPRAVKPCTYKSRDRVALSGLCNNNPCILYIIVPAEDL